MKSKFENTRNMWGATLGVLTKYEDVIRKRAPFMRHVATLREAERQMDAASLEQGKDLTGIRDDKDAWQMRAAEKADYIGDILQAFALDNDNQELYRAMMFGVYDIVHLRDNIAYDKIMEVHGLGKKYEQELAEYGLQDGDLEELAEYAAAFKGKINAPRGAIVKRSVATDDIPAIARMGNKALHVMDKMINTFAKEYPDFVAEYKKARIIVDAAAGHVDSARDGLIM